MLTREDGSGLSLQQDDRRKPLLSRFVLLILLPLIVAGGYLAKVLVLDAVPAMHSEVRVPQLSARTVISRDQHATVYIRGGQMADVYFATGYAHAQDRLWQLELQRRLSQGKLSEVFGKSMLQRDIYVRSLGIRQAAALSYQQLDPTVKQALDAYAAGINAWLTTAPVLPVEFSLLNIQPEPWTAVDSVAWSKMFALNLSGNFRDEAQFVLARQYLSDDQLRLFYPKLECKTHCQLLSQVQPQASRLLDTLEKLKIDHGIGGRYVGSNAWVVAGKHTDSGRAILANDPHLGLQQPSLWYAIEQRFPDLTVSGMSLVGLPFVIFGKNDHIAWGGTSMMADVQDLYVEKVNPLDGRLYWQHGRWQHFNTAETVIKVRAEFPDMVKAELQPVRVMLRSTERGPVISDLMPGSSGVLSLQWVALQGADRSIEAFYRLNFARNWQSFTAAFSDYKAPALNLFYADAEGNIGFRGIGQIPVRQHGTGQVPLPAEQHPQNWQGYIPFAQMPAEFNPASGMLLNANNANVGGDYPYFISDHFAPPDRANRIKALLQTGSKLSIASMAAIQADVMDLSVDRLLPVFAAVPGVTARQKKVIQVLAAWDQQALTDSVGASIYYGWARNIRQEMFQDELAGYWNKSAEAAQLKVLPDLLTDTQIAGLLRENSVWCDDATTAKAETCADALLRSLDRTVQELEKLAGTDLHDWTWGKLHQVEYQHTPFSQIKPLDQLFDIRFPAAGNVHTVNVAAGAFDASQGYRKNFGAGFRQIIQLSPTEVNHHFINSTGQSGHIASRYYSDQNKLMQDNAYLSFGVSRRTRDTVLLPLSAVGSEP